MRGNYEGLPPAASVEQAIVLAQLLIVKDLERRTTAAAERSSDAKSPPRDFKLS
jgi:hypothetical protein